MKIINFYVIILFDELISDLVKETFFKVVVLLGDDFEDWKLRHDVVFVLKDTKERVVKIAFDVFLVTFVLWGLFLVKMFRHIGLKVHLNCVHSIASLFVPGSSLCEDWPQLV